MSCETFAHLTSRLRRPQLTSAACYENLRTLHQAQNPQQQHLLNELGRGTGNRGMRRLPLQWRKSDSNS